MRRVFPLEFPMGFRLNLTICFRLIFRIAFHLAGTDARRVRPSFTRLPMEYAA